MLIINNVLRDIFYESENDDFWSAGFFYETICTEFFYDGPLPTGNELLLVSRYLIKKRERAVDERTLYYVKPFNLLTKYERTRCIIKEASL
jgi:hypothetical protein